MAHYRILIVDDQREVSRLLHSALETLEYDLEVVEIPSGEEAILDSSRNNVDLLVSDYRLPGLSGIDLMHNVKKNHPNAKIILITGQTDPQIRKEVAEAGANAFFIKPVPMADFLDAVERHLGLVEAILPPEPIAVDEEEVHFGLPDLLAGLRQELAATTVLFLNDTGRILARAGNFPDNQVETALISSLLSIYSGGQKASRIIGQKTPSNWFMINGDKHDLVFSPVGSNHAMLVIGKGIANEEKILNTVDCFTKSRKKIEQAIGTPLPEKSLASESPAVVSEAAEPGIKELEPLLKDAKKKLKPADVNEFWDKAVDKHKSPTKPDMLSYDQARQLGLAPEGNEEES
jgi:CheY-like chemotaxis protein